MATTRMIVVWSWRLIYWSCAAVCLLAAVLLYPSELAMFVALMASIHFLRRPVKGKDRRHSAQGFRPLTGAAQQRAVSPMYAVKKTQGNHSLVQGVHAPKKFLREVMT